MAVVPKPPQSVVLKTPKPTPAQKQRVATLKQTTQRGAPGVGGASMDSLYGIYNHGPVPPAPKPPRTGAHGLVSSPVTDPLATKAHPLTNAPVVHPKVKVQIHPDGTVTVHHGGTSTTATPTPYTGSSTAPAHPATASAPSGSPTHGKPHPKPAPTRAPVNVGGGAPQLSLAQQAQAELDPVKQAILDAINQRVGAQQGAINGYTKELADLMGSYGPAAKAVYGGAQGAQAAVDSATGATLQGQGGAANDQLAAKLAAIDADPGTAARVNGTAASNLQGAGGSLAAGGSTALSDLISRGASAQDYGAKQKGVAGLYGLSATKTAQSQATTDTANAVAQLEQQVPGLIQNLKTNMTQQQQIRFEHGAALLQANGGVVTPTIRRLLGGALPVGPTAGASSGPKVDSTLSKAYGVQTDTQGKAILGKDGKPIPYPTAGGNAPKVSVALSKAYGILVDNTGSPILHQGKPVEYPTGQKATGALHGLSQSKYQTEQAKAAGLARIAHEPTADGHPGVSWQQYLTGALKQGVPWWVVIQEGKKVYSQAEIKLGLIPGQGK